MKRRKHVAFRFRFDIDKGTKESQLLVWVTLVVEIKVPTELLVSQLAEVRLERNVRLASNHFVLVREFKQGHEVYKRDTQALSCRVLSWLSDCCRAS